jgi:hypothetical protein
VEGASAPWLSPSHFTVVLEPPSAGPGIPIRCWAPDFTWVGRIQSPLLGLAHRGSRAEEDLLTILRFVLFTTPA